MSTDPYPLPAYALARVTLRELMDVRDFAARAFTYLVCMRGSVTSWHRSAAHNLAVGGRPDSAHLRGLACDVVYDGRPPELERAVKLARECGLTLVRETGSHDHLQLRPGGGTVPPTVVPTA